MRGVAVSRVMPENRTFRDMIRGQFKPVGRDIQVFGPISARMSGPEQLERSIDQVGERDKAESRPS